MPNKFLTWLFDKFDNRSTWEKKQDEELVANIRELRRTHHVRISSRGLGMSVVKKTEEEMKNESI
jgi:hypothetical protein